MKHPRRGISLLEVVVATGIVLVASSIVGRFAVSTGRIWQQTRYRQMALEELSNQWARLGSLDDEQLDKELETLTVSDWLERTLPQPTLTASRQRDALGDRLVLRLQWAGHDQQQSTALIGWVDARPQPEKEDTES
jgi:Tfp pilus assembly protein PilV